MVKRREKLDYWQLSSPQPQPKHKPTTMKFHLLYKGSNSQTLQPKLARSYKPAAVLQTIGIGVMVWLLFALGTGTAYSVNRGDLPYPWSLPLCIGSAFLFAFIVWRRGLFMLRLFWLVPDDKFMSQHEIIWRRSHL